MRSLMIVFIALILASCKDTQIKKEIGMKDDVYILANDSLKGRQTGTREELMAASYIEKRFRELGLKPKGNMGTYTQTFTFRLSKNPHEQAEYTEIGLDSTLTGTNVIGYIDNNAENTVIIGAHYDHLGMGGDGSLFREGSEIHNGADDNASGVAVMLDIVKRLISNNDAPKGKTGSAHLNSKNYLFIAFSGEEMGLLGSNYFLKNPTIDTKKVSYMLNMDMVGRLNDENTLAVHGVGTSPIFKQVLFANKGSLKIAEHESGIGPSDHTSFYLSDIPVLHFFTGQHSDYHKPGDDSEKLNYKGMQLVSDYIFAIVSDLDKVGKLVFRKTKNESEDAPRFKVALGVVPDYLYTGKGMRIDGVSDDKPAQKAGLIKGDVVVQLGKNKTPDMMGYMKALAKFESGDSTVVTVERDGKTMEFAVTF
ncbi:M28 family peptidase [Ulvibacter antarcticus]|uniref:PDZ domain-containing protein n=1 Tax=Ulvibacter antarcticus TaxID=442714 RepID=A0A3L9ZIB2_9FLAO|nr:M28 family peptidase [Ulvibacter antarcticus]RMA66452.1 PDZ domain-containing protein [Ulvibacter antarcticus]